MARTFKQVHVSFPVLQALPSVQKMNVWVSTCTCTCTLRTVHVLMRDGKQAMYMYNVHVHSTQAFRKEKVKKGKVTHPTIAQTNKHNI